MNFNESIEDRFSRRFDGTRLKENLERFGVQFGVGTGIEIGRSQHYKSNLKYAEKLLEKPLTKEEMLALDDSKMYDFIIRNAIAFISKNKYNYYLTNVNINVTRQNKIVTTALTGLKNSVKEFVYAEDYKVIVSGMLLNEKPNAFPINDLRSVIKMLEDEGQIAVESIYLNAFEIDTLVLESYDIPQSGNKYVNQQDFTLTFLSDKDVELEFN
jgi:hypothetical protein